MNEDDSTAMLERKVPVLQKCANFCSRNAIYFVLMLQIINFCLFLFVAVQIYPLKLQIDPIVEKSNNILKRVNIEDFSHAVNKASIIIVQANQTEVSKTIDKTNEIIDGINKTEFVVALAKTTNFINTINETSLIEAIDNVEHVVLPSINRLLPVIENNVTPTFDRLVPILDQIPEFINDTETFLAQIRGFFKHVSANLIQKNETIDSLQ